MTRPEQIAHCKQVLAPYRKAERKAVGCDAFAKARDKTDDVAFDLIASGIQQEVVDEAMRELMEAE